ncbi:DnaB-like helicase C-terminal domain-containing protein, partial [Streptomyces sp. NPDC057927]
FCLYKEPELFGEYDREIKADQDFMTDDGKFYYSLGREMYELGYKSFDDASIYTYIDDKETLKNGFNRRGGYKEVDNIKAILNVENVERYYDELIKNNMLLKLNDKGFNVVNEIEKFNKMNSSQLYDYFEYQLDNVFLNRGAGVKIEDLEIDAQFIEDCDAGIEKGLSYASTCPILNYHTLGLHRSNVQIFAGFSGTGKSSFAVNSYVMPILDQGENMVIIANEMNIKAWKHLFMATILSHKLNYFGLPRKKQKSGGFNEEQKRMAYEAKKYYEENYKGRIKFVKIYDYSIEDVKRIMRKMSKQGFNYYIYDTFKAKDASSDKVTGELIEASKQLLQVAEKENICIIITMQLAIYMENTRYLTGATLSNSKGVKEVVSELVLMRKLWDDEYTGQKFDIKPWRFRKDATGKITGIKEELELIPDKKYRILFLDKTRNDEDDMAILLKFEGSWNSWREIGYCSPKHQQR